MGISSESFAKRSEKLAPRLIKALQARKFEAYYCPTAAQAVEKALSLIPEGSTVSWGGSATVQESGLLDRVREQFPFIDRDTAKSPEERTELMRRALTCDTFLTSVNGMSEDGILVNVDGLGNRIAAMLFGPKSVIVLAGMNKVCRSAEEAESRARNYAAPLNAARFSLTKTPCGITGACGDCQSDECMCSYIVKIRMSKVPGRIKVILVGEPLGF